MVGQAPMATLAVVGDGGRAAMNEGWQQMRLMWLRYYDENVMAGLGLTARMQEYYRNTVFVSGE